MDNEELLAQLADIHLPGPVGFWPPAIGWWLLTAALLIGTFFALRRYLRNSRQVKICQHALAELERCYSTFVGAAEVDRSTSKLRYVNEFNSVIRRVALVHFPSSTIASLDGQAWVDFIREKGESSLLNEELAAAISYGRFRTQVEVDVDKMNLFGQQWISSLYLPKKALTSKQQGLSSHA